MIVTPGQYNWPAMKLNEYAATKRLRIHQALLAGEDPPEGEYDAAALAAGRVKGEPRMGATRYQPHAITFEYLFPDPGSTPTLLSVRVPAPQRIVFMPVPDWVVENIWQGEIDGQYHFESDAVNLLRAFEDELGPGANEKWFGPRPPKRRE